MQNMLKGNENSLHRLDEDKRESFKLNFLELWNNQYLIQQAVPTELLDFAIQITNLGLSINPYAKELYILPFNEKGKNGKKLEAVFRKEAIEKLSSDKGFFIESDNIWSIDGEDILESEMTYARQARLEKTNVEFVNKSFLGFRFTLSFMGEKNVPKQHCIVGMNYLKTVTKQLQSQEHKIANYAHKAYRKAFSEFNMSAGKRTDMEKKLAQLEALNYNTFEAEVTNEKQNTNTHKKSLQMSGETQEIVTVEDITALYKTLSVEKKSKMLKDHKDWRTYDADAMRLLKEELEK